MNDKSVAGECLVRLVLGIYTTVRGERGLVDWLSLSIGCGIASAESNLDPRHRACSVVIPPALRAVQARYVHAIFLDAVA